MVGCGFSVDQGGALAKSAEDLAMVLDVMASYDARDSTCVERPKDDYVGRLAEGVKGLTIGMPREDFSCDLARDVAAPLHAALAELRRLRASLAGASLP